MGLASSTLRIGLGTVIVGHGLQKLAGKFGGPGLDGTADNFEKMGFKPGRPYALAAALSETVGGGLVAAGMYTPLGASMVTGAMTVAIAKVHLRNGLWAQEGGLEYPLLIITSAFALTEHGSTFPAVDGLITKRRKGFGWALFELALGVGAAAAVITMAERGAEAEAIPASAEPASSPIPTEAAPEDPTTEV